MSLKATSAVNSSVFIIGNDNMEGARIGEVDTIITTLISMYDIPKYLFK
jgi:hypothetical protein